MNLTHPITFCPLIFLHTQPFFPLTYAFSSKLFTFPTHHLIHMTLTKIPIDKLEDIGSSASIFLKKIPFFVFSMSSSGPIPKTKFTQKKLPYRSVLRRPCGTPLRHSTEELLSYRRAALPQS